MPRVPQRRLLWLLPLALLSTPSHGLATNNHEQKDDDIQQQQQQQPQQHKQHRKEQQDPSLSWCHAHEWDGQDWCVHCHEPCIGQAGYNNNIDDDNPFDVFWQWNCVALEANVEDHMGPEPNGSTLTLTQGPPLSARALAMIHIAMWDAYNAVNGGLYDTYMPADEMNNIAARQRRIRHKKRSKDDHVLISAAVATAAHTVMADLYQTVPSVLQLIDRALAATLDLLSNKSEERDMGIDIGQQVGLACLRDRATDGYAAADPFLMQVQYTPTMDFGSHDVDPINPAQGFFNPGAGDMTPFMDEGASMSPFLAPIPPGQQPNPDGQTYTFDPSNPLYLEALAQVKELGAMNNRMMGPMPSTLDDPGFFIGNYWSYNGSPCTGTPPRLYNMMARQMVRQFYGQNTLEQNALLFTMLNVGLGNAGITSWESKFHYSLWRPIMGIRQHPDTAPQPDLRDDTWEPLGASRSNPHDGERNFSPPFPAYTSGHATFGAVALKTLMNFFQTNGMPNDDQALEFISDEWNGFTLDTVGRTRPLVPRVFTSLTLAMAENAASRVFNGVHWSFDGLQGVVAGTRLADYIYESMFLPASNKSTKKSKKKSRGGMRERTVRGLRRGKSKKSSSSSSSPDEEKPSKAKGKKVRKKKSKSKSKSSSFSASENDRTAMPNGDFAAAIDCILANPDYQRTGACRMY